MDKVVISGVPPWDGEYPFDGTFKNRELRTIKQISGLRAGELVEALNAGDTDFMVALAAVMLQRAGKNPDPEELWNAEAGAILYVGEAEDAGPPAEGSPQESSTES